MKRFLIAAAAAIALAASYAAMRVWPAMKAAKANMDCTTAQTPPAGVDACTRAFDLAAQARRGDRSKNGSVLALVQRAQYRLALRRDDPQALADLDQAKRWLMEESFDIDTNKDPYVKRTMRTVMAEAFAMRWTILASQGHYQEALAETEDAQRRLGPSDEWRQRAACSVAPTLPTEPAPICRELASRAPIKLKF